MRVLLIFGVVIKRSLLIRCCYKEENYDNLKRSPKKTVGFYYCPSSLLKHTATKISKSLSLNRLLPTRNRRNYLHSSELETRRLRKAVNSASRRLERQRGHAKEPFSELVPKTGIDLFGCAVADPNLFCGLDEVMVTSFMLKFSSVMSWMKRSFWERLILRQRVSCSRYPSEAVRTLDRLLDFPNLVPRVASFTGTDSASRASAKLKLIFNHYSSFTSHSN